MEETARVPANLKGTSPLSWTVEDVQSWLEALSMSKYKKTFSEAEVDGLSLFDLTAEELKSEGLIGAIGSRKKFLRARSYLISANNIMAPVTFSTGTIAELPMFEEKPIFEETPIFEENGDNDEEDSGLHRLVPPKADPAKKYSNISRQDENVNTLNQPAWMNKQYHTTGNVTGGITVGLEIAIQVMDLHPAAHLVLLFPGVMSAMNK